MLENIIFSYQSITKETQMSKQILLQKILKKRKENGCTPKCCLWKRY